MNVAGVPKPASAGSGRTAITDTQAAYVNVRNGPGTQYTDVGDVRDKSLVVYYPDTRTGDGWVWVEQRGVGGWVYTGVVSFEDVVATQPAQTRPTPYDGQVAVWHWKGAGIPENTIEELVASFKRLAPNVKQVWVKTSDGSDWQGRYDNSAMAINGTESVDRWVSVLAQHDMEFHAWCIPKGLDIEAEANIINAVCKRPGVKSMILDVEPYAGFWEGGKNAIRPLMLKVRQAVGGGFHIGMSIDPRPWHYDSVYPGEWFPFVNSVHPQSYWYTFQRTPEETLQQTYDTWGGYGHPVIPALQGDAPLLDQQTAHTLATQRYGATGLSWWRYGVISQYGAVNTPVVITSPTEPVDEPTTNFTDEKLIIPGGDGFRNGTYTGKEEFQKFDGRWGWEVYYTSAESQRSKVWAEWKTELPESGTYQIATFVPTRHATTNKARFKIHGIKGTDTEVIVEIDQQRHRNQWVSLGIFDLVKGAPNAGKVFLNDVTHEEGKEIAFDAIRWRRIVTVPSQPSEPTDPPDSPDTPTGPDVVDGVYVANGYDSPVGSAEERSAARVWPSGWADASPFAVLYFEGTPSEAYHTGADLNWGSPYADKGLPIYSCASGVVVFAAKLSVWGNVIVIKHDPLRTPNGYIIYSRYGHVQDMLVQAGQRVKRGEQIAEIGDAFGRFVPHLHFDLSPTTILETRPSDWPGKDLSRLLKNYIDPKAFIRSNRP